MFDCFNQHSLFPAQSIYFINNVKTYYSVYQLLIQVLYCVISISLYDVYVIIHDCNVIKSERSIRHVFKYYSKNPRAIHSHIDIFL